MVEASLDMGVQVSSTPALEPKYQKVVDTLQNDLRNYTAARAKDIRMIETHFMWGKESTDKKTNPEILKAARKYAVDRVLEFDYLNGIKPWDDQMVSLITGYLHDNYGRELRGWIEGPDRWKLDPERIEQIEKAVTDSFGIRKP